MVVIEEDSLALVVQAFQAFPEVHPHQAVGQSEDQLVAQISHRRQFAEIVVDGKRRDRRQFIGLAVQKQRAEGVVHGLRDFAEASPRITFTRFPI